MAKTYLGLELSGAKNQKTTVVSIQYDPKRKIAELQELIEGVEGGDFQLLKVLKSKNSFTKMGVNAALALPPCIACKKKTCPLPSRCNVKSVKWMRETVKKFHPQPRPSEFTPYTQRPVEIWLRYHWIPDMDPRLGFEIDETLGGSRAPLTARMNFLLRHLKKSKIIEVLPKLTVGSLATRYQLDPRYVSTYRHLEKGLLARKYVLDELTQAIQKEFFSLQIKNTDLKKFSKSLLSFDALICAITAIFSDLQQVEPPPKKWPKESGWIHYPRLN